MQVVLALKLRVQFSDTGSATYNLHTNINSNMKETGGYSPRKTERDG